MSSYEICVTALAVTFTLLWVFEKTINKMLQKFIDENHKNHMEFLEKLERQLKVLQSAYPLKGIKGTNDETKETSKDDLSKD